jgi:hypothetical protein
MSLALQSRAAVLTMMMTQPKVVASLMHWQGVITTHALQQDLIGLVTHLLVPFVFSMQQLCCVMVWCFLGSDSSCLGHCVWLAAKDGAHEVRAGCCYLSWGYPAVLVTAYLYPVAMLGTVLRSLAAWSSRTCVDFAVHVCHVHGSISVPTTAMVANCCCMMQEAWMYVTYTVQYQFQQRQW